MTTIRQALIGVALLGLLTSSVSAAVVPTEFELNCIIQSGTAIPGSPGLIFDEFSGPIPMRGSVDTLIFGGANQYGSMPSYDAYTATNGTITPLDYETTLYDDKDTPYTVGIHSARCLSSDNGTAAFVASGEEGGRPDFFLSQDGSTRLVFDNNAFTYHGIFDLWYRNDTIVFRAHGGPNEQIHGAYAYDVNTQAMTTVAVNGTPLPDGTTSGKVNAVCYDGNRVAFRSNYGIYSTTESGDIRKVVNDRTRIPGSARRFYNLSEILIEGDYTYFVGADGKYEDYIGGIFREKDGTIEWVYEWEGDIYKHNPPTSEITCLNVYDGNLAFIDEQDVRMICTIINGVETPLLQIGDMLNGKTVSDFNMSDEALGDGILAFSVTFNDDSHAVYTASFATVPEPSTVALLFTALFAIVLAYARKKLTV